MDIVHSGEEILPKALTPWRPWVGCTNVTDRRQTDKQTTGRQTDDRWNCDSKDPSIM